MAKKAGVIWVDAQGERVLHIITTLSGVGGIETALTNHSNADVVECFEGLDEIYTAMPIVSTYPTVRVTAQLNFTDSTGSRATLFLPAPDQGIFLSDGITVDPTAISDILTAAYAGLLSGAGNLVTIFSGGQLINTKFSGIATAG